MTFNVCWVFLTLFLFANGQNLPASILEDARVHPSGDGSFGFLYRTQDGIAHAAKGDPGGAVHGRFTYTDPTGLKVNYNYNAGAQAVAAKHAQQSQAPAPVQSRPQGRPVYVPQEESYRQEPARYEPPKYPSPPRSRYVQPQPRYQQYEESRFELRYEPTYESQQSNYEEQEYEPRHQPKTRTKYGPVKYAQYEQPEYEPVARQSARRPSPASQNYVQDYEEQYYQ